MRAKWAGGLVALMLVGFPVMAQAADSVAFLDTRDLIRDMRPGETSLSISLDLLSATSEPIYLELVDLTDSRGDSLPSTSLLPVAPQPINAHGGQPFQFVIQLNRPPQPGTYTAELVAYSTDGSVARRVLKLVAEEQGPIQLTANWWDAGFFAWPGWPFVQALGAIGTLAALFLLFLQFKQSGSQLRQEASERREDYERARTPDVSMEVTASHGDLKIPTIDCKINADGGGVAYNVILNVYRTDNGPAPVDEANLVTRYLRAPGSKPYALEWPHGWGTEVPVRIEIPYRSAFGRQYRVMHSGFIGGNEGLRITDEPTVEMQQADGTWSRLKPT
jgi:hypothetical protein